MPTRRDILRTGLAGTTSLLFPWRTQPARALRPADLPPSPRVTPFLAPLPLPDDVRPVAPFQPSGVSLPPQAHNPPTYHELIAERRFVSLHPHLPPTAIWGYRDANTPRTVSALGPTIVCRANQPLIVRHRNALPADHVGFGVPNTTVHFHGGHVPAGSDGFPEDIADVRPVMHPGESRDYAYPMLDPGFSHGEPDATDRPATMWYHDHLLDYTAQNVYRGLIGLVRYHDELDTGDETTGLRLPSGAYDVPLVFMDRQLDALGQLAYNPLDHNGFLGDTWLVNGAIQPYLNVQARKYRLRLLNGCNARFLGMQIVRADGTVVPFDLIATEAGLMSSPLRNRTLSFLSPAQREDIILDFGQFPVGTVLYVENRIDQPDGRGPRGTYDRPGLLPSGPRFLKIIVGPRVADPSRSPDVLRPFQAIAAAEIASATRREFQFGRRNGAWMINGLAVDLDRPLATVRRNTPEVWVLRNNSGGWWHPIHIHLEFMHVLKRNGQTPPPTERDGQAKRDVITLGPNDEVEVFFKFRDYPGRWVFHCHTLEHEDAFMMACFDVV
jgi:FtsP/CotA-like multicopper oxidase with cupredoxin domain